MTGAAWATDAGRLGVWRSKTPPGTLPHIARVLDAESAPNEFEVALHVERLAVDATSFGVIAQRGRGEPAAMARLITGIVADHGKLQNPWTGSGGVVMGRVASVGRRHEARGLSPGQLVVPLASAICIPLKLESVGPVRPSDPQVPARGRAIVTGCMHCARVPEDLDPTVALTALDVYPVASHVRALAAPESHVLVLGSGHAGLLAVAAARRAVGARGQVTVVDRSSDALGRAEEVDSRAATVRADVTSPLEVAGAVAGRGRARADLTLLCTSAQDAEGTAILVTAPRGTVLFFSTATRFAAAALGADAIGSQPHLVIPHGLTDDRGDYAFELLRSSGPLRLAFGATA
jgi:L-erythro-3,5-diaminohexanoate dehydrogenase